MKKENDSTNRTQRQTKQQNAHLVDVVALRVAAADEARRARACNDGANRGQKPRSHFWMSTNTRWKESGTSAARGHYACNRGASNNPIGQASARGACRDKDTRTKTRHQDPRQAVCIQHRVQPLQRSHDRAGFAMGQERRNSARGDHALNRFALSKQQREGLKSQSSNQAARNKARIAHRRCDRRGRWRT